MLYLAAVAAVSFNLICSGTTEKTDFKGKTTESYSVTYRVDTASRTWCIGPDDTCRVPDKLADISPAMIKFIDATTDTPSEYFKYVDQVDRGTGRHQSLTIAGRGAFMHIVKQEGICRPDAFSGFPKTNPKF